MRTKYFLLLLSTKLCLVGVLLLLLFIDTKSINLNSFVMFGIGLLSGCFIIVSMLILQDLHLMDINKDKEILSSQYKK